MSNKTGGPAFPSTITDDSLHVQGMTLRDYFAAKAMQAIVGQWEGALGRAEAIIAEESYKLADAMLRAREEGETND